LAFCDGREAMAISPLVKIPAHLQVTDEQFMQLVKANPDLRLERTAEGELLVMPPTGSEGGNYNAEVSADLVLWNRRARLGKVFDSSTGFRLPNGAIRAPDTAWVAQPRWDALTPAQRQGFAPLCPDFVLELASATDDTADLRVKMQEYFDNGCRLGWLIDPRTQQVEVYRPAQPIEVLQAPATLSGEEVLPGFVLDLHRLFSLSPC
jgi:Uma2 family endonuclease